MHDERDAGFSVKDFEERFALHDAAARRRALADEILADRVMAQTGVDQALEELREE